MIPPGGIGGAGTAAAKAVCLLLLQPLVQLHLERRFRLPLAEGGRPRVRLNFWDTALR
jgi:hypothetical protein